LTPPYPFRSMLVYAGSSCEIVTYGQRMGFMAEVIPTSPQEVYKRSITIATPVLGLSGRQSWDLPQHAYAILHWLL
jgi:hypothetical protein